MSHSGVRERVTPAQFYPSNLNSEIQRALASLADVESRYEIEREAVEHWSGPSGIREHLLAQLDDRHTREREPLVQRLAELQQRMTSAMMFAGIRLH